MIKVDKMFPFREWFQAIPKSEDPVSKGIVAKPYHFNHFNSFKKTDLSIENLTVKLGGKFDALKHKDLENLIDQIGIDMRDPQLRSIVADMRNFGVEFINDMIYEPEICAREAERAAQQTDIQYFFVTLSRFWAQKFNSLLGYLAQTRLRKSFTYKYQSGEDLLVTTVYPGFSHSHGQGKYTTICIHTGFGDSYEFCDRYGQRQEIHYSSPFNFTLSTDKFYNGTEFTILFDSTVKSISYQQFQTILDLVIDYDMKIAIESSYYIFDRYDHSSWVVNLLFDYLHF